MMDVNGVYQRVFAKINLDALIHNYKSIIENIDEHTQVLAVLKTDAYGHCAVPIAKELQNMPKLFGFALATAEEAFILRNSGITKPLLVLGYTFPEAYEEMIQKNITFTVFRKDSLSQIAKAVRKLSTTEHSYKAKVHIKLDTGMGRIGVTPDEDGVDFLKEALKYDELIVEGLFTHFSKADEEDRTYTLEQLEKYNYFVKLAKEQLGFEFALKHVSNSAGIIEYPEANMDLVRAGIILYGLWPSDVVSKEKVDLKPVLSLHSKIVFIKKVPPGTRISYGGTYITQKDTMVATVPVGYGEGYPRMLSNKADVLVNGQRCPIIGRICMDQLMIDVTNVKDVCEGDTVTLVGQDGAECITLEELGEISGRFNYEMACDFGKRIPRVFFKNMMVKYTKDYFEDF